MTSEPAIYLLNNDFISGAVDSEHEWLRRSVAVTSGDKRGKLEAPRVGDLIALHVNGIGIVAVGVVTGAEVREVRDCCVNPDEPWEFHRDVDWLYDLRQQPISTSTLNEWNVSRTATGSFMKGDRPAKMRAWLASRQPMAQASRTAYERLAEVILALGPMHRPAGNVAPEKVAGTAGEYHRDPAVRAWTIKRSGYVCECCDEPAPFKTMKGDGYLESHHLTWLSRNGPDTPGNTLALCPNCHRELHFGEHGSCRTEELRIKVLERERELGPNAWL